MGLFTYVKVDENLLPEKYRKYSNWQTKDVIQPFMDTLFILSDGCLYLEWFEIIANEKYKGGTDIIYEPPFRQGTRHFEKINFHGIMNFGDIDMETHELVDLYAKFTDGKLVDISDSNKNYHIGKDR